MRPEEIFPFVIVLTIISAGFFLLMTKMILRYVRDRRKGEGASLGTSELEAMIGRAVETGSASLHDRLDDLEARLDGLEDKLEARPRALPEARPLLDDVIESAAPVEVREGRRAAR
jgi:hypothetical protein